MPSKLDGAHHDDAAHDGQHHVAAKHDGQAGLEPHGLGAGARALQRGEGRGMVLVLVFVLHRVEEWGHVGQGSCRGAK